MMVRIILILMFSNSFLEIQAVPYTESDAASSPPSPGMEETTLLPNQQTHKPMMRKKGEVNDHHSSIGRKDKYEEEAPVVNESPDKQSEQVEFRSFMTEKDVHVPGIDLKRYVELGTKPYPDGTDCGTGQAALNPEEAKLVREYYANLFEETTPRKAKYYILTPDSGQLQKGGANCESGTCSLDVTAMSYVCGPVAKRNFTNGLSCIDGSKPNASLAAERQEESITKETERDINKDVTKAYGMNCKSGKCFFDFKRDAYLCSAPSLQFQSITTPILAILTLILRAGL